MEPFQGRSEELHQIGILLEDPAARAIALVGRRGVGKTDLAYQLLEERRDRFEQHATISAYMTDAMSVISTLARALVSELPAKPRLDELSELILSAIASRRSLILLDNVDCEQQSELRRFVQDWARQDHRSKLLLTAVHDPFPPGSSHCVVYSLNGLKEEFAVRNLLGCRLARRFDQDRLQEVAASLGRIPQKLLYLRWRDPEDERSLDACVRELQGERAGASAVDEVLKRIEYPVTHFLALARIRDVGFDHTLLAFLWDRLGGGSAEAYGRTLETLVGEKLIRPEEPDLGVENSGQAWNFRISADVHVMLEAPLARCVGEKHLPAIDFFISAYYRNLFALSRTGRPDFGYLERYVYHALRSVPFEHVFAYVFEGDILPTAHQRGQAVELARTLAALYDSWVAERSVAGDGDKLDDPGQSRLAEQGIRLQLELAHVDADLSRHGQSLERLHSAQIVLETSAGRAIDSRVHRELQRRIWYHSGVANSTLGRSRESVAAYERIVLDSRGYGELVRLDVLALGYLGHELRYHDMGQAIAVGRKAVSLGLQERTFQGVAVKNLSSYAQTLLFAGQVQQSMGRYQEALELVTEEDSRERGRILTHSAVPFVVASHWRMAAMHISTGAALNRRHGDRRRAACATAYCALLLLQKGNRARARERLLEAIEEHAKIDDWRNLASEVLTLLWLDNPGFGGTMAELTNGDLHIDDRVEPWVASLIAEPDRHTFVDFWRQCVRVNVLDRIVVPQADHPVAAVLFDLYDTLTVTDHERTDAKWRRCADLCEVGVEDYKRAWRQLTKESNEGLYPTTTARMKTIVSRLGSRVDEAVLRELVETEHQCLRDAVRLRDGAETLLRALRTRFKLGIVTNASPSVEVVLEQLALRALVDCVVTSSEIGCRKPDPAIYEHAADRLGVATTACVFIGDGNDAELDGAFELGMRTIRLRREAEGHLPSVGSRALCVDWEADSLADAMEAVDGQTSATPEWPTWSGDPADAGSLLDLIVYDSDRAMRVSRGAAHLLIQHVGHPSFHDTLEEARRHYGGGEADRARARELIVRVAQALYEGIRQDYGLVYEREPRGPAGPQRVRTLGRVFEARRGTCLDLVLVYLGCLEHVSGSGLYLQLRHEDGQGHALAGIWTVPEDVARRRPREVGRQELQDSIGRGEIVVVDCTGFADGRRTDGTEGKLTFEQARAEASLFVAAPCWCVEIALNVPAARPA